MAKIRVYELARELNLKNKQLLDKLHKMQIEVASHMSSLDDEAVARIKQNLFGRKEKVSQDTRVKPTVIRRRPKAAAKADQKAPEAEAPPPEEGAPEQASAPAEPEAPRREETAEAPPAVVEAESPAAPEPEPEAEPRPTETEAIPTETAAPTEPAPEATTAEPAPPPEEAPAEPAAPPTSTPEPEPERSAVKAPAKAKAKKDTPAKIIKLPERPAKPESKTKPLPVTAEAKKVEDTGEEAQRKKKKKRAEEDTNKRFFKKKISFRKKAVVEGEDLYTADLRGRKGRKGAKAKTPPVQKPQITVAKAIKRRIKVDETIVLSELGKRMGLKANELIGKLMGMGVMTTVNQTIDFETAALVASEFGYEVEKAAFEEEALLKPQTDEPGNLRPRPPVVTIMGHVDHGKTSLLDVIRKTHVTEGEAGGITQHIGAYHVSTDKGQIVFLDTPGHEAFTAMRSRGARLTDIVVLVVAADDGVMPQTVEAINHAKAAEVPIIVAVNKMDKPGADPERVMRQLADSGLSPEQWGGDTIFVHVSAKQRTGISDLLEMISLQAEMMDLQANPDKLAKGHVVEAKLDAGRGAVATVLVQEGTLRVGDPIVCGVHYGKVRALIDDRGNPADAAGPSIPVEILGLSGVPAAGDEMIALADEKDARQVSAHRQQKQRSKELAKSSRLSLETLFEQMKEREVKELNLIIKADVHGSIEALSESLVKLSNEEVKINIIHAATGTITESDVSLATVSDAIIIGFNVRPNAKVQAMATEENVDIRFYNVIYTVIKEVQDAIVGMMESRFEEKLLGRAEVRQVFHVPKVGAIAGSYVTEGKVVRGERARLLREGVVQYEGKIGSLRRFKDDAKEVLAGYECGIGIENYNDIKVGDAIEVFIMEEIRPKVASPAQS
ncbi:MAG TPA: translation initiation factor IF-2 [Desulfobacteraceae bacterium]|nr:MAG: translation initiation factor IF-2 [Deltaproteobacteria bacterium]HDI60021.1 translation initiation factor IF-2 [Desulfobacteraceae bacterium]